eukprot:1596712-Rhodomonas_salina.2
MEREAVGGTSAPDIHVRGSVSDTLRCSRARSDWSDTEVKSSRGVVGASVLAEGLAGPWRKSGCE